MLMGGEMGERGDPAPPFFFFYSSEQLYMYKQASEKIFLKQLHVGG